MRQLLGKYLGGGLSRRDFLQALVAAGYTTSAAGAVLAAGEAGALDVNQSPNPAGAYRFAGTGAELLAEQLKAAGTRYIFTNPGSLETAFFDALTDRPELQVLMGLHEGVVLSSADGYNKVSGKPAFVNVHAIAGTGQMGGQMFNVHRDGSALFISAGMNDTTTYSDDLHLAPAAGANQVDINDQFTKLSWEVRNGASTAIAARRALKLASTAPGGPVYVAYSGNALQEKTSGEVWPADNFMIDARPRPAADKLEALARKLIEADRPTIVFGDEVWRNNAQPEALELAELLGVAVASGQQGFVSFPAYHPQSVGRLRTGKNAYPFGSHDLVVQMGARDPGGQQIPGDIRTVGSYVVVGMNTDMLGRTQPFDLAIVADVKVTLSELIEAIKSLATKVRLDQIRAKRLAIISPAVEAMRTQREAAARKNFNNDLVHPDRLDYELNRTIDPHAIVAMENLTGKTNFMRWGFRENEKMFLRSNGTSLGWGVGAAIGAQVAAPDRQVVLSIGDGSTMYSASGFWTMARYDIPVLTVVWNNHNYQTVRHAFHRYGGRMAETGNYHGMYLGNPEIDFVGLARSQGVQGERVKSVTELESALKRGVRETKGGRPYLVEVMVSRYGGGADSTWHHEFSVASDG